VTGGEVVGADGAPAAAGQNIAGGGCKELWKSK